MTDITELAQSLKAAAEKATPGPWEVARDGKTLVSNQSHPIATVSDAMHRMLTDGSTGKDAEFIAMANPANIRALVEALEKAQTKAIEQGRTSCELFDEVTALRQRIAELESRSVKLPSELELRNNEVCSVCAGNALQVIEDKLTAAGIKWEAE
ncbi:ead/Ea22-like family protein [Klebsiella pneumoniae]|uniref:ead/Ea22-like family protein n=1 Tax=Klebsiella pneumoniae TaxID=573 RepID=UPI0030760379|nr:ead/Ea22-like family protein [Klebsiella pneumoniae]